MRIYVVIDAGARLVGAWVGYKEAHARAEAVGGRAYETTLKTTREREGAPPFDEQFARMNELVGFMLLALGHYEGGDPLPGGSEEFNSALSSLQSVIERFREDHPELPRLPHRLMDEPQSQRWKRFCKAISDAALESEGTDFRGSWNVTDAERAEIVAVVDAVEPGPPDTRAGDV